MARPSTNDMLDGLSVLCAVVEAGSFMAAAEALGVTQPADSRCISRLEARVGARLFQRSPRSISLTDDGRAFHESVLPHLRAIEAATNELGGSGAKVRGRLRVNIDPGTAQLVLAPRLGPFLDAHPSLFVELAVTDRLGDLVRDGIDVAVRFGNPEPSTLRARLLMRTRVVTCASAPYLARHGTPRQPSDIEAHRCVLMRDPLTGTHFAWEFVRARDGVPVNVKGQMMVNHFGPMLSACLAGQGVAQFFQLHVREHLKSGRLVRVLPDWADETYPLYALYHSAHHTSAKVRAFVDYLATIGTEEAAAEAREAAAVASRKAVRSTRGAKRRSSSPK